MTGMELMLKSVFKSLGIDGDQIVTVAEGVQTFIDQSAKQQAEILARVQRTEQMVRELARQSGLKVPALEGTLEDDDGNPGS